MSKYSDYESKLAPPWLRGPGAKPVLEELGGEKDVQVDRARQSVLSNFPDQGPVDALAYVGADRLLPVAVAETPLTDPVKLAAYRERLRTAWDSPEGWAFAGSHGSLLRALARGGFPTGLSSGAVIVQRTKRYSYLTGDSATGVVTLATHSGWTFDGTPPAIWNQFGVIFGADVSGLADGSASAQQLNALVKTWKPSKARFMGTWIVVSGSIWGWPIGVKWGDALRTWGGSSRFVSP